MEHKNSMSRVERLHREKVTRYSIRKYSFGAASVAVAALFMFLGNGAVSANELSKQDTPSVEAPAKATEDKTISEEATAKPAEATTPTLDKSELTNLISEIETKLSNGSYDNKTEESVAVLKADLEAAKATLANATTQAELKKAYSKLVTTANTKLKNKPVEKKETPEVDTTNGKETVGKKAENTEKKSESNSIENTGSKDPRNGKELDKNNAFRAETDTEKPTVEIPFANGKNVYVYSGEAEGFDIKIKDNSGFITSATVKQGGNQNFNSVAGETDKRDVQYGYTINEITTKTPASDASPAVIHYRGVPGGELSAAQLEKIRTEGLTLGWRYVTATDEAGNFIENRAVGSSNATDPGSFNVIAKPQTFKYDPVALETANKVVVADLAQLTETDLNNIKNALKVEYSKTNDDAQLASKKGTLLDDAKTVVSSVAQSGSNLTVTYKDGSTDSIAVSSVARVNAAPTVEIPYSDPAAKEVYVYGGEENSFDIKFKDDSGKITSATVRQGGNKEFTPVAGEADKINVQYGYKANVISTETPATEASPAVITYRGTPAPEGTFTQANLEAATKGENPPGVALGWRYATATDADGALIENRAVGSTTATDPGAFRVMLKPQTQKYDIKNPETKISVANANNITEDEFNQIKDSIKIQYSTTNSDKNLADKKGQLVDNQTERIESITRNGNDVVVTYKDGSQDKKALADFVNVAPKVELPYSNEANKQIYVYTGENTDLTFKGTDENEVKDLYLRGPGDVTWNNADKYGFTTGKVEDGAVTGEGSVSEDKRTATIKMTGVTTLKAPNNWTSYLVSKDNDGKLSNTDFRALDKDPNARQKPGYVQFIVKNQTSKYDIAAPTEKVAVADPANVTEDDLAKIKEKLQLEYNKNNDDANISKDSPVTDKDSKIKSLTKDADGNLVVTYTDGSTDKRPLSEFVTLDKQPAIEAVEKAAEAQIAAINNTPNATDAEKTVAIAKVNADKEKALAEIAKPEVTTKEAVDAAKTAGTGEIAKENPVAKEAAKKAIDDALKAKEAEIAGRDDLTNEEKDAAKAEAKKLADAQLAEIAKQPDVAATPEAAATAQTAVDGAKDKGVADVTAVNPAAAKKPEAKKAIDDALKAKEAAIDARTDLTDDEKKAAKDAAKDAADKAKAAIDAATTDAAVDTAKTAGTGAVEAVTPVAKAEAKKAIADALKAKEAEIAGRDDLTNEEKDAAKAEAKKLADAQLAEIAKQPDVAATPEAAATAQTAVDGAKDKGVADVTAVNPAATKKPEAKKAIDDALKAKEAAIDARTDLTDDEKKVAKDAAKAEADKAKEAIDAAPSDAEVDKAKTAGTGAVEAINPEAKVKPEAKKAIDDALKAKEAAIDARTDLTDDEKKAAKDAAKEAADKAKEAIDAAPSNAEVDKAKEAGTGAVEAVTPVAKAEAKKAIADALKAKEAEIAGRDDLTNEEKDAAKAEAKKLADAQLAEIAKQPDVAATPEAAATAQTAVDGAKDKGVADVTAVNPAAAKKPEAKKAIDDALKAKEAAIDARTDLTDDEKKAAKDAAKDAADKAKAAIDAATTDAAVDTAKTAGTGAVEAVTPVAKAEAKKAIADALKAKEAEIAGRDDLTNEEKDAAKAEAKKLADAQLAEIAKQPDVAATPEAAATAQTAVDGAKDKGVADVTAVNPAATKKPEAKKAIDDALKAKEAAIDARTDLTDDEKKVAKDAAKAEADKAKEAIDAAPSDAEVDKAKTAGTGAVEAINPEAKVKPEAKKAIDDALKAKEAAIDARTDLTDDEKKAAKDAAKEAADKAKEAIDAAPSNAEVDKAKEAGTGAVEAVTPVAKAEAKKAIADALKAKEAEIAGRDDLTNEEKDAAKAEAKKLADAQLAEIAKQPDVAATPEAAATAQTAVDGAKDKGVADVTAVNPAATKKPEAKKAIDDALKAKEAAIDARTDLTDDEKKAAKDAAKDAADKAKEAIDAAPSDAEVDKAKEAGTGAVEAINPEAKVKPEAKKAIDDALKAKEAAIDARTDLTDDEKKAAKEAAKDAADKVKEAIDAAPSNAEVDKAKEAGTGAVEAINPEAKVKPEAKKAIDDALKAKEAAIDARTDLTDDEKKAAKDAAKDAADKAKEAIDAAPSDAEVDKAKEAGTGAVEAINPEAKAKPEAKKAIDDALKAKEAAIDARTDLTDDEKKAAKDAAKDAADKAKEAIDAAPSNAEVDKAKEAGTGEIAKVNPVAKEAAKKAVEDELAKKEAEIAGRNDLTDEEKAKAKEEAQAKAKEATDAIDAQPSNAETPEKAAEAQTAVDGAKDKGVADVTAVNPEAKAKPEAKKAIDDALKAKEAAIDARTDLTDDEKKAAKEAAKDAADKAKEAIDAAPSDAEVDKAKEAGTGAVEAINPEAKVKPEAKKAIDDALKAKEAAIDARTDLTDDEKKAAKEAAKDAADKAKEAIDAEPSNAEVDKAKEAGTGAVEAINPEAKVKPEAKKAIDDALKAKEAAIDARTDLTDDEKKAAKEAAKDAADKAKEAIDAAPSNAEVDKAKEAGTGAVEAINPEAKAKPAAKKAIDDALKAKEDAIDARTDLTDDEKKAAKDAAKDAADKAKEAIDAATDDAALNKAKEAGIGEIAKVNPVAKEAAKKAVADELAKKEAEIAGRNDLTDEEKAKAKEEAQAKAKEATDAIDAQPNNAETPEQAAEAQTAVDGAKDKGVADVTAVNPAATKKPEAKQAIDDALKAKEAAIDARTDLTDDEKKAAKDAAKDAADKAKEAIDAAPSNAEVDKAKEAGTGEIAKVNPVAKEAAKKAVADELKAKEAEIAGRNDLTDEEKAKAKEEAQAKAKEATDAIDAQPNNAETPEKAAEAQTAVDGAKDKGVADVKAVDPEAKAKPAAKKAIEDKLAKQLEDIANTPDATDDEKKVAADAAKALADEAKKEIDNAKKDADVAKLQDEAEKEIEKSVPVVEDKPNARKAIEDEAKAKKEAIDARTDLTPKAKEDLKAQVDAIADQAKKSVDAAKTSEAVDGIEESDKAAIKAVGEVNIPADKVLVNNPSALTDDEKAKVLEAVKKVNPDAKEITQDADGNVTVITPDGHKEIITPEQVVKTADTANDPKAGNDIVKPADKVVVNDPAKLTDAEKEKIKAAVEAVNPNSIVVVDDKGNAKVSTPDGQTQVIPVEELVRTVEDTKKPNAGNDIVKPADKTAVKDPANLTPEEKKAIEDKVKAVNPGATVVVDDKGNATVTTPEGKTAVIPATDLTKDSEAATKPNAGNDIVKPADKTAVKDPANLTPEEKKAIEDKVKAVNPGATVVVDDKGNATVTTPEGKTAVIPAADLTKDSEAATKPNAGNDIVKPADKTAVKDPANLTPEEKKAIEDKVKAVNPGAAVVVDDKGNATVTTPEGKTAVIPAADLTKDSEAATKPNAGNDIVKPADKTAVKDPANLTPEEKKAIEDKVKAVNPDATVVVDDKGNATVTTPEGKTAVIPATDLTKDSEAATKPNAGNDIVKPADKTAVKDPANLTPEEKKAIEDKVKAVNPGATVVVDDKGNATVTTPEGKTAVIPATDLTKSPADAAKANAGNTVNTPAAKVEVKDPAKLTDEEKAKVKEAIEAVNPGSKVVVDDKGNATVTTPEGDVVVIPTTDLTKSPADAGKANAGNAVNTPAAKVEVKDPAKLTDEEKAKVKKAVEDVNPGSKVVVDDKGNTTVTTSEGKTATIPAADVTKSAADAGKANAGNAVNTPAAKVEVKDPANLTDAEKKAIEDKVKAVNPGSKVVVDDKGNVTVTTPEGKTATIPAADVTKSAADAGKANAGNGANTPATKTVVKDPAKLTDEEKAKVKKAVEDVNPGSTVVVNDKGDVIVTKGDGTVLVIPELDLVIPEDKLTDPTQQNGVNTPATRVLVGDKAKLTADEIEKVKESIKAVNPGSTVVVDDKGNATVTTPEGKTATIPAAQLVKDAKDVAAKNNGENINVDFEKETVADFNNLTDAEKEAAKAKIKGANADVVEVIFDKAGNATVITKDGKVYTIVAKDIFKQRPYVPSNGGGNNSGNGNGTSGNNGATNTDAKVDKAKLEGAIRQLDELIVKESAKLDAETAKEANALLADAKKVFANADASQAEVDAMVKRIEGFMAKVASSTDHATPANDQAAQTPAVDTATTQAASAQANARKVAKELPNTGTADSTVAMVAAAASALLGLGLAGRRRKEDEEA